MRHWVRVQPTQTPPSYHSKVVAGLWPIAGFPDFDDKLSGSYPLRQVTRVKITSTGHPLPLFSMTIPAHYSGETSFDAFLALDCIRQLWDEVEYAAGGSLSNHRPI